MANVRIEGKPDDVAAVAEALRLVLNVRRESKNIPNRNPADGQVRRYLVTKGVPHHPPSVAPGQYADLDLIPEDPNGL